MLCKQYFTVYLHQLRMYIHIQQIETHYVSYYGWGLTPISKFKVNCLTYIIARIQ